MNNKSFGLDVICPKDTERLLNSNPSPRENAKRLRSNRRKLHRRNHPRLMIQIFVCFSVCIVGLFLLIYISLFTSYNSRIYPLESWAFNTSRNVSDYVLPNRNTVLRKPRSVCDSDNKFFLLIMVSSSLTNFEARQNIRETWGNVTEFNYPMFWKMHSKETAGTFLDLRAKDIDYFREYLNMTEEISITNAAENKTTTTTTTLLRNHNIPVKVVFILGRHIYDPYIGNETQNRLENEIEDYDDILQEDFLDTYNNLTIKSVMMLKWIAETRCYDKFKFLVKCDDDSFINIPNLLHYLLGGTLPIYNATVFMYDEKSYKVLDEKNRLNQVSRLLVGYKFCKSKPIATASKKWYMPYYMFPNDTYPNYLSGGSYILSSDIVSDLYRSALNSSLIYLEDIFVTGVSAEHAGIQRKHNPLFLFNYAKNKCVLRGVLSEHYIKGDRMRDSYNFLVNLSNRCPSIDHKILIKKLNRNKDV